MKNIVLFAMIFLNCSIVIRSRINHYTTEYCSAINQSSTTNQCSAINQSFTTNQSSANQCSTIQLFPHNQEITQFEQRQTDAHDAQLQQEKGKKVKRLKISGIVSDENGKPLSEVIIMIVRESDKEHVFGIQNRADGSYIIICPGNRKIRFIKEGFEQLEVEIKNREEIDVVLKKVLKK